MKYKGSRGSEYRRYIGKTNACAKCGEPGYLEVWYCQLGNEISTVKHKKGNKTTKRCFFG